MLILCVPLACLSMNLSAKLMYLGHRWCPDTSLSLALQNCQMMLHLEVLWYCRLSETSTTFRVLKPAHVRHYKHNIVNKFLIIFQSHTILLVQPGRKPESRTYSDYESVNECLEGECQNIWILFPVGLM